MWNSIAWAALACACASGWAAPRAPPRVASAPQGAGRAAPLEMAASRSGKRSEQRAVRDLSLAMIELKIPANAANRYAEWLAADGVRSERELPTLAQAKLDACDMRRPHRQLLQTGGVLLGPDSDSPLPVAPLPPEAPARPGRQSAAAPAAAAPVAEADDDVQLLTVGDELGGARLDAALAALLPPLSRTYFGALCAAGRVTVGGRAAKKSARVASGDVLAARLQAAAELSVAAEELPLDVLYEDASMIAVSKAAGMVVHPAPGHWSGTFANALVHRVQAEAAAAAAAAAGAPADPAADADALPDAFGDGLRPGIVHRLDRFTSGVLLGAKTGASQRALLEAFASRRVFKVYLAVVAGMPAERVVVDERIGRHPTERVKMAVRDEGEGRAAYSEVHRLASDGRLSLVAVRIGTGRTHQIRVHAAHLRCPVLGDPLYGDANWNAKEARRAPRPLLHAYDLRLAHPTQGTPLRITAPLPADLATVGAELAGVEPSELEAWLRPVMERVLASSVDGFEF